MNEYDYLPVVNEDMNENQVLNIVSGNLDVIKNLQTSIEKTKKKAAAATANAESALSRAEESQREASSMSTPGVVFGKKEAIEDTQQVVKKVVEAQVAQSEAQNSLAALTRDTIKVQEATLEYEKKLTEISRYLFALGCSNMAANRTVVRRLKLALEGASDEQFDELAKQEIEAVIKQLKAQEDLINKQENLEKADKAHAEQIKENLEKIEGQEKELVEQKKKDKEHDRLIAENKENLEAQGEKLEQQEEKDKEHDRLIAENKENLEAQEEKLEQQEENDRKHDRLIAENKESLEAQEEKLNQQVERDKEHDRLIAENKAEIATFQEKLDGLSQTITKKAGTSLVYMALALSVASLILAIINFVK